MFDLTTQGKKKLLLKPIVNDWKAVWKERGPDGLPEWMKAKKYLFEGYIKLWVDKKAEKTAAKNSKNRGSQRGVLGVAKYNNSSITFERKYSKMVR